MGIEGLFIAQSVSTAEDKVDWAMENVRVFLRPGPDNQTGNTLVRQMRPVRQTVVSKDSLLNLGSRQEDGETRASGRLGMDDSSTPSALQRFGGSRRTLGPRQGRPRPECR